MRTSYVQYHVAVKEFGMTLVNGLRMDGIIKRETISGKTTHRDYIDKNKDNIAQPEEIITDTNNNGITDAEEAFAHIVFRDKRPEIIIAAADRMKVGQEGNPKWWVQDDLGEEHRPSLWKLLETYEPEIDALLINAHRDELKTATPLLSSLKDLQERYRNAPEKSKEQEQAYQSSRKILLELSRLGIHPFSNKDIYMLPCNILANRGSDTEQITFDQNGRIVMVEFKYPQQVTVPGCDDKVYAKTLFFSTTGALTGLISDKTFSIEIPNGKGGTTNVDTDRAFFHENGTVSSVYLGNEPEELTVYVPEKTKVSMIEVRFDPAGRIVYFEPEEPFLVTTPDKKYSFLATKVTYDEGALSSAVLKNDTPITLPGGTDIVNAKADTAISFHKNGMLRSVHTDGDTYTLTMDGRTLTVFPDTISFFPDGRPERFYPGEKETFTLPRTNIVLSNCGEVAYHVNGSIASVFRDTPFTMTLPDSKRSVKTSRVTFFPSGNVHTIDLSKEPATITLKGGRTVKVREITYADDGSITAIKLENDTVFTVGKKQYTGKAWGIVTFSKTGEVESLELTNEKETVIEVSGGKAVAVDRLFFWANGNIKRIDLLYDPMTGPPDIYGNKTDVELLGKYPITADHCIELDEQGALIKGW